MDDSQNNNYKRAVDNLEKLYRFASPSLTAEQQALLSYDLFSLKLNPAYGEPIVLH